MAVHHSSTHTHDAVSRLVSSWSETPAFLCDRHLSIVASNQLARALSPAFAEGSNVAQFVFLEPELDRSTSMFDDAVRQVVALLRDSANDDIEDAALRPSVEDLAHRSPAFATAWADQTSTVAKFGSAAFSNTRVGRLHLDYVVLRIPDNAHDRLFAWVPHDAVSTTALERLSALTVDDRST